MYFHCLQLYIITRFYQVTSRTRSLSFRHNKILWHFNEGNLLSWARSWLAWRWFANKTSKPDVCLKTSHSYQRYYEQSSWLRVALSGYSLSVQMDGHASRHQATHFLNEVSHAVRRYVFPAVCCFLWFSFHNNFIGSLTQLLSHLLGSLNATALCWSLFWASSFHSTSLHSFICV